VGVSLIELRPMRRAGVDFRILDDASGVAIDPGAGAAHALNPVASAILERCDGALTVDEIADDLGDIFDAPPEVIAVDVRAFVDDLAEKGLVEW
jgi:coenzyme PQQ biosynthesis protein PqqD